MPTSDDEKREIFTRLNGHDNRLTALETWREATQDALGDYVTLVEFRIVRAIVFGMVGLSLMTVFGAILSKVIIR
jgi:hypothetical protein